MRNQHKRNPLSSQLQGRLKRAFHDSSSFRSLPDRSQRAMATGLTRVLSYLTRLHPNQEPVAPSARYGAIGQSTGLVGDTFAAIRKDVDFPAFIGSLVESVFQTIVSSSIQQMEAYSAMVESVAKSVEQYALDEVSDDEAETYLKQRYPNTFNQGSSGLQLLQGLDPSAIPNFQSFFGPNAPTTLSGTDDEEKAQLLLAAKVELARTRQQMLATMVLMGINRIIVTDGSINAKVVFDVSAVDKTSSMGVTSTSTTDQSETNESFNETGKGTTVTKKTSGRSWWGNNSTTTTYTDNKDWTRENTAVRTRVSTVDSTVLNQSSSEINAKAQLTGEVRINFRSETFPLERIADAGGLDLLQNKSQPLPIRQTGAQPTIQLASPTTTTNTGSDPSTGGTA